MALGDSTNQNKQTVEAREGLTRIRFYNPNSSVDPSTLQITYLFGMMCLKFSPMMKDATPDNPRYDYQAGGKVFITHMDALVLMHEIELFEANPSAYTNLGCVNNSGSLLSISNGVEFGITSPCMVLRKIDEKGDIVYTYVYELNNDRYSIRNFDEKTKEYDKFFYGMLELEMLKITLDEYVKATTNAIAYSLNDLNRFQDQSNYNRISQIHEKLGIEKPQRNGNNNHGGKGMFDSNPGRNSNTSSNVDDVEMDIESLL